MKRPSTGCQEECVAVCGSVLQCVKIATFSCCLSFQADRKSVLQCVEVCCNVWQCVAVCCSVCGTFGYLHHCADGSTARVSQNCDIELLSAFSGCKFGCVAVCCSVLQCGAVRCKVLWCVTALWKCVKIAIFGFYRQSVFPCVAVCCSVLQCVQV